MSTPASPPADAPVAPARRSPVLLIGAIAGLLLGGGVGAVFLAPGPRDSAAPAPAEAEHESAAAPKPAVIHAVENLVVNPAQSNGSRFLLVTTAIVVRDEAALAAVAARDTEIRDRIVGLLSQRSVAELSDPLQRDALRSDLAAAVGALFDRGMVERILLPQFVIQ